MYRKTMTGILAAGLVFSFHGVMAQGPGTTSNAQSDSAFDNKIIKKINSDNMYNTVAKLSLQPREAGTEGELVGVNYIKSQFEQYGYETELQPFPIYEAVRDNVSGYLEVNGQLFNPYVFSGSHSAEVTGQVIYVRKALAGTVPDAVKGKIALIERGDITFVEKIQNVLNKGAIGVIMYNNSGSSNAFGQATYGQNIPAVAITKAEGLALVEKITNEPLNATIKVAGSGVVEKTSYNVIAKMKPNKNKDNGQVVMIGAHHDSVHNGPGANDDASGVSAVLELARVMANMPTDTELRFVTFGAEEKGLLGSYHYASTLSNDEADRIVAHFQMDMVGSKDAGANHPAGGLIMYTIDGKKNLVTDLGAAAGARTAASEILTYGKLGRSDHQPFHELGIPAALFIHSPLEPWYHSPADTIDKIDKNKLQEAAEIVGASVYQIARPDTPALQNARVAPGPVQYDFEDRPVQ
ncbi:MULTISPECIES: M28 family peptidase [unclassified Bacillus (in: firmicutes)]|uniref:M28 family peptidase n=1 Tax=unclassified Bacillus (in: firmicutes) TaxID=185979 RepID=UPI0008E5C630|nr:MULTISPECIES: M28 family peptidase [unclassified Bacillus (in: firmicutes)]SFA92070.1 Zn-dependent amino-or carboxypeptidase, M28 family [Bacillus sp. UNCCL13]SFQ85779.1 Zn-dependent amino-or carboxypeptidase, M28 family [Bacillus sp. cl95]